MKKPLNTNIQALKTRKRILLELIREIEQKITSDGKTAINEMK
jgi:hypothetical protein